MGTWNSHLFSNDTTCDVKDTYIEHLKHQLDNEEAYKKTLKEFKELIGTDEEPLFWYALADTQWNFGRLSSTVRDKALNFIAEKGGLYLWEGSSKESLWINTLQKLKEKLESPVPEEKRVNKPIDFIKNPWNIGDIYAYQFHSDISKKHRFCEKYIVFQKIGNVEYYKNITFSAVQIFDKIFENLPKSDDIKGIRILPLVNSPGNCGTPSQTKDYIPSFEWYMKTTMIYDKKTHYPKKHFTFIGNQYIPETEYKGNDFTYFFWEKDKMEDWLIEYYLSWKNCKY